jgi:hypothetical protein
MVESVARGRRFSLPLRFDQRSGNAGRFAAGDPAAMPPALARAVNRVDPDVPIAETAAVEPLVALRQD